MADPLSILGATIAVVDLTGKCVKLVRSKIGPFRHSTQEIESVLSNLNGFSQTIESFKKYAEDQHDNKDHDGEPLDNLAYLKPALEDCKTALRTIDDFAKKDSLQKFFSGARFDRKLKGALSSLSKAKCLFSDVVGLNNYASSVHIKQLIKNLASEVQKLQPDKAPSAELFHDDTSQHGQLDSLYRARTEGSCAWLFQHDVFRKWLHEDDASPLLWVEGHPGLGNRFDTQRTVTQAAGYLLDQLFDYLYRKDGSIALAALDITRKTSDPTTDEILTMARYLIRQLQRLEDLSSTECPKLLIFLDGLDEKSREEELLGQFVLKLLEEFPSVLRVWVSSLDSQRFQAVFHQYPTIHLRDHTHDDVRTYLGAAMYEVDEEWHDEDNFADKVILPKLLQRCRGNFLLAKFLVNFIKEGSFRPNELPQKIQEQLPIDLSRTYQRILQRYEDRKTASELFSIVAFARRPLRLRELEEAMAIVVPHKSGANLNLHNKPWRIEKMFNPLIEKIHNRDEPQNPFVQIIHSTVKDYLTKNSRVLCHSDGDEYRIGEYHIADACLSYLMQKRYSHPFESARFDVIEDHHFLTYSAKYWNRHLDAVGSTRRRYERLNTFLYSPNFQTLLQVQSIALESHFGFFPRNLGERMRLRKLLPQSIKDKGNGLMADYYHFLGEWRYLLSCPCRSEDDECDVSRYRGEITRCLSGIMGRGSFLSNMKEENVSFMLQKGDYNANTFDPGVAEGFHTDGSRAAIVSSKSTAQGSFSLTVGIWGPRTKRPSSTYNATNMLSIDEKRSNWSLYAGKSRDAKKRLSRPDPISFSADLGVLRVGSQLLQRDKWGSYKEIEGLGALKTDLARYFEEFAVRDGVIVMTRRRNRSQDDIVEPGMSDADLEFVANIMHGWRTGEMHAAESEAVNKTSQRSSSQSSDSEESDDGYSAETDDAPSDYTSCGDVSCDDNISSESEAERSVEEEFSEGSDQSASSLDVSDEDDTSDDSSENLSDHYSDDAKAGIILAHEDLVKDPTGYVGDSSSAKSGRAATSSSDEDEAIDRYAGFRRTRRRRGRSGGSEDNDFTGSIAVINIKGTKPQRIFHHSYELPVMLYHSPPAIHPSKPIVVWPLCGGDILFIDYAQKTYFTRSVQATTRFTRHVCMKVHFSECGTYMHIATIEAQDKGKTQIRSIAGKEPKQLSIAVFVTTYQLREDKTSTRVQTLIHRVKARLGNITNISVTKLPITFTWTRDHVYVTQSSYKLTVMRVNLFRSTGSSRSPSNSPMIPRETVPLPASAQQREVRYFPPTAADRRGVVLIGSHRSQRFPAVNIRPAHPTHVDVDVRNSPYRFPSPPVGLYVDEDKDLGGWVPARTGDAVTNRYRNGVLIRKIEPFDAEDDCELEDFATHEDLQ
ncbi:hypothetical protein GGR52DRAFT_575424 [Hypoxylon sp. FL1284]|nr:hypothetical protein GGR52DRAFT_575424 [Hypoxylon sp. FL1284]